MDAIPMGLEHSRGGVGAWMCPRSRIPCGVNLAGNAISITYPFNLLPCIPSLHALIFVSSICTGLEHLSEYHSSRIYILSKCGTFAN